MRIILDLTDLEVVELISALSAHVDRRRNNDRAQYVVEAARHIYSMAKEQVKDQSYEHLANATPMPGFDQRGQTVEHQVNVAGRRYRPDENGDVVLERRISYLGRQNRRRSKR